MFPGLLSSWCTDKHLHVQTEYVWSEYFAMCMYDGHTYILPICILFWDWGSMHMKTTFIHVFTCTLESIVLQFRDVSFLYGGVENLLILDIHTDYRHT